MCSVSVMMLTDESAVCAAEEREPVSGFVVTFNEERNILDCLQSLSFCDEIVVVDSYSTDRTVEIAEQFGARVIQREWPGHREQKSFALAVTSHEWVLNIDADERVSDELRESILEVLRSEGRKREKEGTEGEDEISGYYVNRVVHYLGRWWRRGGWYPEYRLRLLRKSKAVWGGVDPHEKPIVSGKTSRLKGELHHFTYRDMDQQFARLHQYSSMIAREQFRMGRRTNLFVLLFSPIARALKFYFLKRGFREGMAGLIVAITEGYYAFMKYAKLWELQFRDSMDKEGDE